MPQINAYSPIVNDRNMPLSTRQRMLMAEQLQQQAATGTVTPAGKRGLAVGVAQLAAGALGGYQERKAIQDYEGHQQAARMALANALQNSTSTTPTGSAGSSPSTAPAQPVAAAGALPTMARGSALSPSDRDLLIRTVAGEAGGESPDGQAGVASVIKNRMASGNFGGSSVQGVVMAPKQFSLWNPGDKAGDLARNLDPNSPQYQRIGSIVDGVFGGSIADPTNGADHYYNPRAASPAWGDALAARNDVTIGNHRFVGGDPGLSRSPQTPGGQLAATPGSTVTPAAMPNSDPGMMADLPAPNAAPVAGQGLPGDMMQNLGAAPIPGSAYAPPADLGGGVVDANAPTPPSAPAAIDPQQQALAAALMQSDPGSMGLTPANPNGAPGAMLQPTDMLNTVPDQGGPAPGLGMAMSAPRPKTMPASGGMNAALGVAAAQGQGDPSMMGAPMPNMGPQDGYGTNVAMMAADAPPAGSPAGPAPGGMGGGPVGPEAQSLAMALQNYGSVPTPAGTDTPKAFAPLPGQTQPSIQAGTFGADVPEAVSRASNDIGDMQAAGLPSFGGLPETNGKKVVLSNSPDFGLVPGAPADAPAAPVPQMAANVPLPPVRPPQANLDALSQREAIATAHDPIATVSHMPSPADVPAPNAQPAMAPGLPGDITAGGPGGGFAPIGKNANFETPQQFNLAQAGNAGLANALMNYQPGQPPAAMSPAQRGALASALQNQGGPAPAGGTGQGSAFGQVMNGADIGGVARQQFANLGGNTDAGLQGAPNVSPQNMALAQQLNPYVIPAPAGAPPAAGMAPSGGDQRSRFATLMQDPNFQYLPPEVQSAVMTRLLPAQMGPEKLGAGEALYGQRADGSYGMIAQNAPKAEWQIDPTTGKMYNKATGDTTNVPGGVLPKFGATHDGVIFNERDGQPVGGGGMPGFRPMTPQEKQANGIPEDQPVQIGPNGKWSGTGGVTVNMGQAQNEYQTSMAKAVAERHVGLMQGVEGAQERARGLNEMQDALNRLRANGGTTGMGQPEIMQLQSAINSGANMFGFQPFDISDKEVINKLNKQISASAAKSLSTRGATNFDFSTMMQANPGLELSPNANDRLIGLAQQAEQRNVEVGQAIRNYAAAQQAKGAKANPQDVEGIITSYDASHHFRDPVTGQDLTANPKLAEFQGQGQGVGQQGSQGRPPAGASAAPPLSQAQQQAASSTSQAQALASARAAIAAGKSRTAVIQRLQQLGINPGGL